MVSTITSQRAAPKPTPSTNAVSFCDARSPPRVNSQSWVVLRGELRLASPSTIAARTPQFTSAFGAFLRSSFWQRGNANYRL